MLARETYRPAGRVYRALLRCSSQKWLSPREIARVGLALARCCSGSPHNTLKAALSCLPEWQGVGLLNGAPPFQKESPLYVPFVIEVQKFEQEQDAEKAGRKRKLRLMELEILKLRIKEKTQWK
jgi:hypothetical protein